MLYIAITNVLFVKMYVELYDFINLHHKNGIQVFVLF